MPPTALSRLEAYVSPGQAFTRHQLEHRFGGHALRDALERGLLDPMLPAVFGVAPTHNFGCRALATSLWLDERGILGGTTALRLLTLLDRDPSQLTAIVPSETRLKTPPWLQLYRRSVQVPRGWADDMFVARADHALVQAWQPGREGVIIDAVRRRVVRVSAIANAAERYPRVQGRRDLQRLLTHLNGGVESYLEWIATTQVFTGREFGSFRRQVSVRVDGRRYVLDMWHEQARLAIELDGQAYHSGDAARQRDLTRDADLATLGVLTIRFTYADITSRPQWCRDRVRRILSTRLRPGGGI
ncbi:endonuclease domain-containing protein [Ornithinimicrobium sp. Arc0846-15]|nr:endonuclease domain-containing protein [Ornithinimicrobium laminariae]